MGLHMGFSRSAMGESRSASSPSRMTIEVVVKNQTGRNTRFGNPDPYHYEIIRHAQKGRHLIVEILYPDCKNYEGRKILVFYGTTMKDLCRQTGIDPHFSDNKKYRSPIARLEPTARGWKMAIALATRVLV